jgi:uncharacterized coiled-coil protein SlyX
MSESTRMDDIEARYAFQEDQLQQLDQVVRELGDQLTALRREVKELRAQIATQGTSGEGNTLSDEKPPHY